MQQQQRKSTPAAASSPSLALGRMSKMQKMPLRVNSSDSLSSASSSSHSNKSSSAAVDAARQRDQASTRALECYLDSFYPLESTLVHTTKQEVLVSLITICEDWANDLLVARNLKFTNIEIFIYGSFRLGVSQDSDDIDASLVVPRGINRGDFFAENGPQSLLARLKRECEVVLAIQTAYIPLLKLIWRKVQVDLVFATLLTDVVPRSVCDGDAILHGLDIKSQLSLSGPRVTEKLLSLVGEENIPHFRLVLRALRHWAKVRGIYNNKFGFLGGINFAILATLTCQSYPQSLPNKLVLRAIDLVSEWTWPSPMQVCHVASSADYTATAYTSHRDLMPIITPAFPNTNSALGVTAVTRAILLQEFKKSKQQSASTVVDSWNEFFQPAQRDLFFARFTTYVVVTAQLKHKDRAKSMAWTLFVESRIRKFCDQLESHFSTVFPYQVGFPAEEGGSMCWIIGVECSNNEAVVLPNSVVSLFIETCMREARDPERSVVSVDLMGSKQLGRFVI